MVTYIRCPQCLGSGKIADPKSVAAEMREERIKHKISLRKVAARMGISAMYLSDLERANRAWTPERVAAFRKAIYGKRI